MLAQTAARRAHGALRCTRRSRIDPVKEPLPAPQRPPGEIYGRENSMRQLRSAAAVAARMLTGALLTASIALAQSPGATLQQSPAPQQSPSPGGGEYIIGPGDTLQVFVWRNPDLSVVVPVRPDGKISTPLVEDMRAVGKTPTQLARDIEKVLSEYVRSPEVNIIITQPANAFNQVKVIGQVQKPQAIPYREGMTVLDALLAVGGLGTFAAGDRSHLVRTVDGKQTEIKLKIDALINKGDMSQNFPLRPGDVLVIPESRF